MNEILRKIKKVIGIKGFDHTKLLIDTNDELSYDITLKEVVVLITFVIKSDGKNYSKINK